MATKSLGTLTLNLLAKTGGFTGPLDKAGRTSERQFKQMQRNAQSAAMGFAKVTTAVAAAAAGLAAYTKIGMDAIDEQAKLARRLDTTIGAMRGIELAASDAGIAQGALTSSLESYNKRLGDAARGTGEAQKAYKALGLEAAAIADMPLPEQLALVADRISQLDSAAERSSIADRLMSGGRRMISLFEGGGDSIQAAVKEVENFGLAISEVDSNAIEEANDSIARLGMISEAAQNAVAIKLAPALGDMADSLMDVAQAFHDGEYDTQIRTMQTMATVIGGGAAAWGTYRAAVGAATIAQWAFNAAFRANPLGAAITVIGAAAGALYSFRDELGLTGGEAYQTSLDVDGLTDAFHGLTAAQQENRKASLVGDLIEMRMEAGKLGAEMAEVSRLVKQSGQLTEGGGAMPIASAEDIARGRELRGELGKVLAEIDAGTELLDEYDQIMADLGTSTGGTTTRTRELTEAQKEAQKEAERFAESLESLQDQLFPIEAAQQQYREEQDMLSRALDEGAISADRYAMAMGRLAEAQRNDQDPASAYSGLGFGSQIGDRESFGDDKGSYWDQWLEGAQVALSSFDELAGSTIENFSERFGSAFESMIFDAQSLGDAVYDMAEGMARSVVSALGEMAAQWLAYQAVQMMVGETGQKVAGKEMAANATATSMQAGIAAYASTAAIPLVGPALAPAAMQAALATTAPIAAGISALGMAHDGMDAIPKTGTWLLEKGERVTTKDTSAKLDKTLDDVKRGGSGGGGAPTINIIENPSKAGATDQRKDRDGNWVVDVVVASITGDGQVDKAMRGKYGVQPRGR